jgi:hypothetical protein
VLARVCVPWLRKAQETHSAATNNHTIKYPYAPIPTETTRPPEKQEDHLKNHHSLRHQYQQRQQGHVKTTKKQQEHRNKTTKEGTRTP